MALVESNQDSHRGHHRGMRKTEYRLMIIHTINSSFISPIQHPTKMFDLFALVLTFVKEPLKLSIFRDLRTRRRLMTSVADRFERFWNDVVIDYTIILHLAETKIWTNDVYEVLHDNLSLLLNRQVRKYKTTMTGLSGTGMSDAEHRILYKHHPEVIRAIPRKTHIIYDPLFYDDDGYPDIDIMTNSDYSESEDEDPPDNEPIYYPDVGRWIPPRRAQKYRGHHKRKRSGSDRHRRSRSFREAAIWER